MNAVVNAPGASTVASRCRRAITPAPAASLGLMYRETGRATPAPATPRPDRGSDR
jgi:hypothetical protein